MPLTTPYQATADQPRLFHGPLTKGALGILCALLLAGAGFANPSTDLRSYAASNGAYAGLVNVQEEGLALGGYDAVSFHSDAGPVAGRAAHALMWKGALWRFESLANLKAFEANPRKYEPRFGGYCAYAMAKGRLSEGSPLTWKIEDGQLYFFHTERAEELWEGDQADMIQSATAAWPGVLRK